MTPDDPWAGLLDPDERILWQGRPTGRLRSEFNSLFEALFMLVWGGIPLGAILINPVIAFLIVPTLFAAIGLWFLVGQHFWAAYRRRRTHYTITTRQVFVATEVLGRRRLQNHPITPDMLIEIDDGPGGTVWFDAETRPQVYINGRQKRLGLEQLADPRAAFQQLRAAQRALTP